MVAGASGHGCMIVQSDFSSHLRESESERKNVTGSQTITLLKLHHSGFVLYLVLKVPNMSLTSPNHQRPHVQTQEPMGNSSRPKHNSILLSCNDLSVITCVCTSMHTLCTRTHSGLMDLWTLTFLPAFDEI